MADNRFMVCDDCLRDKYGGSEKTCSHGWDIIAGKPRAGACSECNKPCEHLHCPEQRRHA